MTGPDHYRLAEELLTDQGVLDYLHAGTPRCMPRSRCHRYGQRFRSIANPAASRWPRYRWPERCATRGSRRC
jgi:hypothetical protein